MHDDLTSVIAALPVHQGENREDSGSLAIRLRKTAENLDFFLCYMRKSGANREERGKGRHK